MSKTSNEKSGYFGKRSHFGKWSLKKFLCYLKLLDLLKLMHWKSIRDETLFFGNLASGQFEAIFFQ
jgi:hypothetical protein